MVDRAKVNCGIEVRRAKNNDRMVDYGIIDRSGVLSLEVGGGRPRILCWLVGLALNSSVGFGIFYWFLLNDGQNYKKWGITLIFNSSELQTATQLRQD